MNCRAIDARLSLLLLSTYLHQESSSFNQVEISLFDKSIATSQALSFQKDNRCGMKTFGFLKPETLSRALLDGSSKFAILDVRSPREFSRGHILGAKNLSSELILKSSSLPLLHSRLSDTAGLLLGDRDGLVIHCRLSLIRGPDSASHLCRLIDSHQKTHLSSHSKDSGDPLSWYDSDRPIYLLEGGFKAWERLYATDPRLVVIPLGSGKRT
jgi:rhodanese-related sulfurtransferase